MTSGSKTYKSKHGLSAMAVGEAKTFDAPTEHAKKLLRNSANKQNSNSDRYYMTRSKGDTLTVTRLR